MWMVGGVFDREQPNCLFMGDGRLDGIDTKLEFVLISPSGMISLLGSQTAPMLAIRDQLKFDALYPDDVEVKLG